MQLVDSACVLCKFQSCAPVVMCMLLACFCGDLPHTLPHTRWVTPRRWEVRAVTGVTSTLKRLGARWGKPVVVGEIGWPSASGGADTNLGSTATARAFAAAWTQVGGGG